MSADDAVHPRSDAWVAAIHASPDDLTPLGAGLVIDKLRVLTCAHVVSPAEQAARDTLWVAFPHAGDVSGQRRRIRGRIRACNLLHDPPIRDLALLDLEEPVPGGVTAAPPKSPLPGDLVGKRWWAFGRRRGGRRLTVDGRVLLVSAGQDATERIWDPASLACLLTVPTRHAARAVAQVGDCVAIGLCAGVLMVKPQLTWAAQS